jgi:hypothetical protein
LGHAAVVRGGIAVDEALVEEALAAAPVDAEVLGEEARDDHARAIVHPAGRRELAHRSELGPFAFQCVNLRRLTTCQQAAWFDAERRGDNW